MTSSPRLWPKLVWLWLIWLLIIWGYQAAVVTRYQVQQPDRVLFWTTARTDGSTRHPYLEAPFMAAQAGWDSEFYLSIALQGYDDPQIRTAPALPTAPVPLNRPLSLNYAFFPVYPLLIRAAVLPLTALGLTHLAAATLAGSVIAACGTLAGLLACSDWLQTQGWSQPDRFRAAAYLLTFPTSFFLAQVYTEGLFLGLSFGCLALVARQRWGGAVLLATVATLTRAVGLFLVIPLAWDWWQQVRQSRTGWRWGLLLLLPLLTHLIWRFSIWGQAFQIVQQQFFGCGLFNLSAAIPAWGGASLALGQGNATTVHSVVELAAVALGFGACLASIKRYPALSLYGLLIMLTSTTCGTAWSISRYLLTVPPVFLVLASWGQHPLFDRLWSLISILLLAMLTALFSFDFWAG
jgi:Gpi18-like mannosyltransferase